MYPEDQGVERWDVLVGATWEPDYRALADYLIERMSKELPADALMQVGRVIAVVPDAEAVLHLVRQHPVVHGQVELYVRQLFGVAVSRACLITAQLAPALVPVA